MTAVYLTSPLSNVTAQPDGDVRATLRVADHDIGDISRHGELAKLSTPLTSELMVELEWAQLSLGLAADEILFAALGRAIARLLDRCT